MFIMSSVLMRVIQSELLLDSSQMTLEEVGYTMMLMCLPSVQHLLLLQMACACHLLHKQRQGLSPIKVSEAVAAMSGSKDIAAAAAAAESAAASSGSNGSSRGAKQQQQQQQQQQLLVPAHHTAVLDLLLAPADSLTFRLPDVRSCADLVYVTFSTGIEFLVGVYNNPGGMCEVKRDLQVPVELCAPLHCMLAEAVALAPGSMVIPHMSLAFMRTLQDTYMKVMTITHIGHKVWCTILRE
jgi:hypothetical protein